MELAEKKFDLEDIVMRRRFLRPALAVFLSVFAITIIAAAAAQQEKREPWQSDFRAYVREIGKDMQKGVDPSDDAHLNGKTVEFEGTLRKAIDATKADAEAEIDCEPQQITVMLKLFPGVDAEKAGDKTGTVTLSKVFVRPAESQRDAWKVLQPGSKLRFRALVDHDSTALVTTSDIGGLVLLFLKAGEVLPPK